MIPLFNEGSLSVSESESLLSSTDVVKRRSLLCHFLGFIEDSYTDSVLLDLYLSVFYFGKTKSLSPLKCSILLSITRYLHDQSMQLCLSLDRSFTLFNDLLVKHSVQRPPFSMCYFSHIDVKNIVEFFTNSYFRYFDMYKYVFIPNQLATVSFVDSPILPEFQCPTLPPLNESQPVVTQEELEHETVEQIDGDEDVELTEPDVNQPDVNPDEELVEEVAAPVAGESSETLISKALEEASLQIRSVLKEQVGQITDTLNSIKLMKPDQQRNE
ncbi:hypothetical protein RCL1_004481 [Eukaryota sp. TZLM3-RCL]